MGKEKKYNMLNLKLYLALVRFVRAFPLLQSLVWKTRINYHALRFKLFIHRPIVDAGPLLESAILGGIPYAAGKMGSTEAAGAKTFLARKKARAKGGRIPAYEPYIFYTLYVNSGVFPQNNEMYDRFYPIYLDAVASCDALVTWDVAGEVEVFRAYCSHTAILSLPTLEPYFSSCVWTRALKGKRVLVISPFVESIQKQYPKHKELWDIPDLLPDFELLTLRAPLSAGLVPSDHADWVLSLDTLKGQMDAVAYDVALIGAGAFSLPLAAHAKKRGKVGIHLGGNLQFLFGIYGKRWESIDSFRALIKPNWTRPESDEKPKNAQINEGGCYW
jgi:hypothetical protein